MKQKNKMSGDEKPTCLPHPAFYNYPKGTGGAAGSIYLQNC